MPSIHSMVDVIQLVQFAGGIVAILAAAWGFYSGWLPRWIKDTIGFYELKEDVEEVRQNTTELREDHEETIAEIQTLQSGQLAIAQAVDAEHNAVDVERLRRQHFGDAGDNPGDFLRGADDD